MTEKERNDFFYLCSLIEFTARKTKNRRGTVVRALGEKGVEKELHDAEVNHCLSFEQVSDELIERYGIKNGDFDTITGCAYTIPGFISNEISRFDTDLYYQNPSYLECSYRAGRLLD